MKNIFLRAGLVLIGLALPLTIIAEEEIVPRPATERTAILHITRSIDTKKYLTLEIKVDPGGQAINAVGAYLNYSVKNLAAVSLDTTTSFCELFIEKTFNNENGKIQIACGKPSPGIKDPAPVAKIRFLKKKNGIAELSWDTEQSMVLANDGFGTNILKDIIMRQ